MWITGLFRVCTARSCKDVAALLVAQPVIIASSLRTLCGAAARKEGRNRTAWSFRWPAAGGNEQCGGQRTVGCPWHLQQKCHFRQHENLNVTTHGRQQTQNKPVILAIVYDAVAAARFVSGRLCTVAQQRPCAASFLLCFACLRRKIEKWCTGGCISNYPILCTVY